MSGNPQWLRLDNTANVYTASRKKNWASLFRFSGTLTEPVDPEILQQAVYRTTARFPSFSMRLRRGVFWHYLQRIEGGPPVVPDGCCPCEPLRPEDNRGFYFRVMYYNCRISVDFFHALTDGTGALSFLKTLLAEYLTLRYGLDVPRDSVILDCGSEPAPEEYEDSFQRYAGAAARVRYVKRSFRIRGTREPDGYINVTCGIIPLDEVLKRSREKGATLTQYLAAVLMMSLAEIQRREARIETLRKPITLLIPVNLRNHFPSLTKRNFTGMVYPYIETRLGEHDFDEVLSAVKHYMGSEVTPRLLRARFTSFVNSQRHPVLRYIPLFLKNPILRVVQRYAGDRKSCITFSNLGECALPPEMTPYVQNCEVIMGPLRVNPTCLLMSYAGKLYINMARSIEEPKVEREFFTNLVKLGIPVKIESNMRR